MSLHNLTEHLKNTVPPLDSPMYEAKQAHTSTYSDTGNFIYTAVSVDTTPNKESPIEFDNSTSPKICHWDDTPYTVPQNIDKSIPHFTKAADWAARNTEIQDLKAKVESLGTALITANQATSAYAKHNMAIASEKAELVSMLTKVNRDTITKNIAFIAQIEKLKADYSAAIAASKEYSKTQEHNKALIKAVDLWSAKCAKLEAKVPAAKIEPKLTTWSDLVGDLGSLGFDPVSPRPDISITNCIFHAVELRTDRKGMIHISPSKVTKHKKESKLAKLKFWGRRKASKVYGANPFDKIA